MASKPRAVFLRTWWVRLGELALPIQIFLTIQVAQQRPMSSQLVTLLIDCWLKKLIKAALKEVIWWWPSYLKRARTRGRGLHWLMSGHLNYSSSVSRLAAMFRLKELSIQQMNTPWSTMSRKLLYTFRRSSNLDSTGNDFQGDNFVQSY